MIDEVAEAIYEAAVAGVGKKWYIPWSKYKDMYEGKGADRYRKIAKAAIKAYDCCTRDAEIVRFREQMNYYD